MPARGPLSEIMVVDLTRVLAGPYCTMILSDLGARVIKVEQPDHGDDARQIGPFIGGKSAYFMSLNRGKESIALDLKDEGDRRIFERLLARADGEIIGTTLSLGAATHDVNSKFQRAKDLISAADEALYHSQRSGRNRCTCYANIRAA